MTCSAIFCIKWQTVVLTEMILYSVVIGLFNNNNNNNAWLKYMCSVIVFFLGKYVCLKKNKIILKYLMI